MDAKPRSIVVKRIEAGCLEEIRVEGRCNMLDFNCVQVRAHELECHHTVMWMEDHKHEWGYIIMRGFTTEEE